MARSCGFSIVGESVPGNFDLKEFATRYTAAWCSQDASRVASFFSANGSLSVNDGAPAVGRVAIQQVAQSFMTAFPDLRVLLSEVALRGTQADYHWILIGTTRPRAGRVIASTFTASNIGKLEPTD
jgi:SnoaL-like domain